MKFDVFNRFTGEVQFTADIEANEADARSLKLGLAVKWALKNGSDLSGSDLSGSNLSGSDLSWSNLSGSDLSWSNLSGSNLSGSDLSGSNGINDFVKCIQVDQYPITYTSDVMQIGCERHDISEWAKFDDARILRMDGKAALKFWRKYKDWIFQTIELCPAKPTKTDEEASS